MNFEEMIRARVNQGATLEELGTEFAGLLNKVQREVTAEATAKSEKEEYLENLDSIFVGNVKKGCLIMNDLTALAVLIMQEHYPDWTVEDMQTFRDGVAESVKTLAKFQGKSLGDMIDSVRTLFFSGNEQPKGKREKSVDETLRDFINGL